MTIDADRTQLTTAVELIDQYLQAASVALLDSNTPLCQALREIRDTVVSRVDMQDYEASSWLPGLLATLRDRSRMDAAQLAVVVENARTAVRNYAVTSASATGDLSFPKIE